MPRSRQRTARCRRRRSCCAQYETDISQYQTDICIKLTFLTCARNWPRPRVPRRWPRPKLSMLWRRQRLRAPLRVQAVSTTHLREGRASRPRDAQTPLPKIHTVVYRFGVSYREGCVYTVRIACGSGEREAEGGACRRGGCQGLDCRGTPSIPAVYP